MDVSFLDDGYDGNFVMLCPECGGNYAHPVTVNVSPSDHMGKTATTVGADGVRVEASREPWDRGVAIAVTFDGECGHTWEHVLHFHKGQTFLHMNTVERPQELPRDVIWRD